MVLFGQNTEQERKYRFDGGENPYSVIDRLEEQYHFVSSGTEVYYDIYIDSEDHILYKNDLSLRFRVKGEGNMKSYGLQLKSEMTHSGSNRMEVDDWDLKYYKVKFQSHWIPVSDLLDSIIYNFDSDILPNEEMFNSLTHWIKQKRDGVPHAFQKLRALGIAVGTDLAPVFIGKTIRDRGAIYGTDELLDSLNHPEDQRYRLDHKTRDGERVFLLAESSLDSGVFRSIANITHPPCIIQEFEVENKLGNTNTKSVLSVIESDMDSILSYTIELRSKYAQTADFYGWSILKD